MSRSMKHWCGCETFRDKKGAIRFSKKCDGKSQGESHYAWIAFQHKEPPKRKGWWRRFIDWLMAEAET